MRLLLLGAPGVGKGSQAAMLEGVLKIPHISTGDILRHHITKKTVLGVEARYYIEKGLLVPDKIVAQIIAGRLKQDDCKNGFILDGFPRTTDQAEFLEEVLKDLDMQLDIIINITLDDKSIIGRLTGRWICKKCDAVYHVEDKPSRHKGICDNCNFILVRREDDIEETIIKRLKVYHEQTKPVLKFYEDKVKIVNIESNKSFDITTKTVLGALGIKNANHTRFF